MASFWALIWGKAGMTVKSQGVKMLLGEIKLEALRLMFINMDKVLSVESLQNLYDDKNYSQYLNNMTGAINRAIDRINAVGVLQLKSVNVTTKNSQEGYKYIDLSDVLDCYAVNKLLELNTLQSVPFTMIDEHKILPHSKANSFLLSYLKKYPHISDSMVDNSILDMPDELSSIIPYYIKGDLYQEDNAVLANDARNLFEQALEELKKDYYAVKTIKRNYKI